jgi:hypothetical protein
MNKQLTPEQRKARLQFGLNLVVLGIVAAFVGPFAVAILHGLGVLLAVGITVGIAWVAMKFLGVFTLMIANASLKAIKAEAMRNPVETLQTEYVKKQSALAQFKQQLGKFIAEVNNFEAKVREYVKNQLEDADIYVGQLHKMQHLQELRKQKYIDAEDSLADFAEAIRRTDTKWKMACAAQHMNEAAGEMEGDVFDKICIETAIESVQTKLNQSFADLDLALLDDANAKKQIDAKKLNQLAAPKPTQNFNSGIDVDAVPVSRQKSSAS